MLLTLPEIANHTSIHGELIMDPSWSYVEPTMYCPPMQKQRNLRLQGAPPQTLGGFATSAKMGAPPPDSRWGSAPNPAMGSVPRPPF